MRASNEKTGKIGFEGIKRASKVLKYVRPYRWYFAGGMVLLILGSLIFMLIPGVAGELVNIAIGEGKSYPFSFKPDLTQMGIFLMVLVIIQAGISLLRTILFAVVSEKGMADIRKDLYKKLITQPIVFFEENRVGELTSRITADVEQLQGALSITLAEFLRQIVVLVSGIVILAWLTPKLSIIMLMTFPAVIILAVVFGRYIRRISKKRQKALADANVVVEETFQNFSVVKSFTNELYELSRYGDIIQKVVGISLRYARIRGVFFAFIITLIFGGLLFILWQGAVLVQQGHMEAGSLFSFVIYTMVIGGAIASFGNLYTSIAGAVGATERIQDILDNEVEVDPERIDGKRLDGVKGDIVFENVHFSYPTRPDIAVLKGVKLEIENGQKVALVGQSGAGKSTIAQLLLHFYDPQKGRILLDGNDLDAYDLTELRKKIAVVPQEVLLFGGTIRENILYGRPDASEEDILKAAEYSHSLDFIEKFPDGFNTIVGERGIKLSGGQRQRVAIARAILKDPLILILDEATSSLDAESEKVVQDALNYLMKGRTSLIIAHRLATIKEVDCIYVLENGEIVEQGTHEILSRKDDGVYSQLAKLQFEV